MSFVLEKISEEDKKKYGFGVSPNRWVIDRQQDAFLLYVGGVAYGEAFFFELHWHAYISKIVTTKKEEPTQAEPGQSLKYNVCFDINSVKIPIELKESSCEIENMFKDALKIWGCAGSEELTGAVIISYPTTSNIHYIKSEILNQR